MLTNLQHHKQPHSTYQQTKLPGLKCSRLYHNDNLLRNKDCLFLNQIIQCKNVSAEGLQQAQLSAFSIPLKPGDNQSLRTSNSRDITSNCEHARIR